MRRSQTLIVDKIKHKCGHVFFENGNHGTGFDYRVQNCPSCGEHMMYEDIKHLKRESGGIRVNAKTGQIEVTFQAYDEEEEN